jgi:hypothetical protein
MEGLQKGLVDLNSFSKMLLDRLVRIAVILSIKKGQIALALHLSYLNKL